jgi:NTE family protein
MTKTSTESVPTASFPSTSKVGLALGSGSARGWAHIGVIRALADAGIEIEYVVGTSIGALVGAAFVLNKVDVLEEFARQLDWKQIVSFLDVTFPKSGLINGKRITDFFRSHVQNINIEEMSLCYCAVATDLVTGTEVVLNQGDLIEAIRASISIPGIFAPVKKDEGFLVDGGLVNPVPVSVARDMGAEYVIAVNLNHSIAGKRSTKSVQAVASSMKERADKSSRKKWRLARDLNERLNEIDSPALSQMRQWMYRDPAPSIFDVLTTSIDIMEVQITTTRLAANPPDLLIQLKLGDIRFLEFHRAEEAIAEGYRETMIQIEKQWKYGVKRT